MLAGFEAVTERVIGCAIEVHRHTGPGLLESVYEACLARETCPSCVPAFADCCGLQLKRVSPLDITEVAWIRLLWSSKRSSGVADTRSNILQGTLDLMVLKALEQLGPQHGYGLALRIEQVSENALRVNQGTIYLCLVRLVHKGWITATWGTSENGRKARFYALSKRGRKQLLAETENWARIAGVMGRVLGPDWTN